MRTVKWFVAAALILAAVPASAQVDEKKINVNFGGGYTLTLNGDARERIGDGYNFVAGMTFNLNPKVGIQVEYGFNGLGQKKVEKVIPGMTDPLYADANFHYLDFNAVIRPMGGTGKAASPYFIAGVGYYYRSIDVTTPSVGYVPPFCDPWWYVCYPGGLVPVDKVVASGSSSDLGINFGAGVDIKLGDSAAFYLETRYHYIWGSEVKDSTGKSYGKANGQFLPITFGIRF